MNFSIRLRTTEIRTAVHNPHFWAILFIICAISIFYYFFYYTDTSALSAHNGWQSYLWNVKIFEFKYHFYGSLFYIPIIYAALVFTWPGALISCILSLLFAFPHAVLSTPYIPYLVTNLIFLLAPFMIVFLFAIERNWRRKERSIYEEQEKERKVYISQIFKAQENERHRIAQELHDEVVQTLLVITNRARALISSNTIHNDAQTREEIEWIKDTTLGLSEEVRRLSLGLRPSLLDHLGLLPALSWLANRLNTEYGVDTSLVVKGVNRRLAPEKEAIVFRIIQEALNNIRLHSKASNATVIIEFTPDDIKATVQDNGQGFIVPESIYELTAKSKLGIIGMQQRVESLGGTFNIYSELGKGTSVSAKLRA
jgi:two-component system, NarL family, sensor histidine kinase DegS